ncbi:MAG: hypothetical protein HYV07_24010 [Deltaproteobacteria bacterium]|nr:hypothetical protein [Deltaproteobacteria bacterium]
MSPGKIDRQPPIPSRVRRLEAGFAFVPNRFLQDSFLSSLSSHETALYLFLVLAGNRQGLSFYHYDRICTILALDLDSFILARNGLIEKDLVAFDGTQFQVLSLPDRVLNPTRPRDHKDRASIRQEILASFSRPLRGGLDDET